MRIWGILFFLCFIQTVYAHEICPETEWDPDFERFGVSTKVSGNVSVIKLNKAGRYSDITFRNLADYRVRLAEIRVCFDQFPHEIHHMYDMPLYPCEMVKISVPPSGNICRFEIHTDLPTQFEARGMPAD